MKSKKLSFTKLIGIIIGSTIGSGIYTTAGDMAAAGSHSASMLIGWVICGIGMFGLMMCFYGLNKLRPELKNGIYSYAREGFGEYVGFCSAWGYWFASLMANVSIIILLFSSLGLFIPAFGAGNNILSVVCASILLWLVTGLILKGVTEAAMVNVITTICKLLPIALFIVVVIFAQHFHLSVFMHNFMGDGSVSFVDQLRGTNSATVWSFLGVESVVVISGSAEKKSDVGKAAITGFLSILAIYVLVCVLSYGVMPVEEIGTLDSPQLAGILASVLGPVGSTIVTGGLVISLIGSALSWSIINAECAYEAAEEGAFIKAFTRVNKNGAPSFSTIVCSIVIQIALIIILFNQSTYTALYTMSITMVMFPYAFSTIYYAMLAFGKNPYRNSASSGRIGACIVAVIGVVYSFWMLYCSSWYLLLPAAILYAIGLLIYIPGRREKGKKVFEKPYEALIAVLILVLAVAAACFIANGTIVLA